MKTLLSIVTVAGAAMLLASCASPDTSKHAALPLDHGPRAQTTPWENKQRLLRAEQQRREKAENSNSPAQDTKK